MATPQPNVQIECTRRGRFRVYVNGTQVTGVTGVEVRQPTVERRGPDGWAEVRRVGSPSFFIEIPARFVNMTTEPDNGDKE